MDEQYLLLEKESENQQLREKASVIQMMLPNASNI
jgi:hypothetical protein